jgi:tetratricopeptide (TPR) repeat protein
MQWQPRFPFVANIVPPPLPAGHGIVEKPFSPFGVLAGIPFTWFALAAPLAFRRVADPAERRRLGWLLAAAAILFALPALVTLLFFGTCSRYEVEFLPALVLLAAVGVLALESAPWPRPGRRVAFRAAWIAALAYSIGFNLCASLERYTLEHIYAGSALSDLGRLPEAIAEFRAALGVQPHSADAQLDLGVALARAGRLPEAAAEFAAALRDNPRRAELHDDLGSALAQLGRMPEAVAEYRQALRLQPDSANAHYNLALVLLQEGQRDEAQAEYQRAIRLNPALAPGGSGKQ